MQRSFFEKYFSTPAALTVLSDITKKLPGTAYKRRQELYIFFVMIILKSFRIDLLTFAKKFLLIAGVASKIFAIETRLRKKGNVNKHHC